MPQSQAPHSAVPWVFFALGCAFLALAFISADNPPLFVFSSLLVAGTWFVGGAMVHRTSSGVVVQRGPFTRRGAVGSTRPTAIVDPDARLAPDVGPVRDVDAHKALARPERPPAAWAWALTAAAMAATVALFLVGTWVLTLVPWTAGLVRAATESASWTPLWLTVLVAMLTGWGEETFFRWALPRAWGINGQWWALLSYTLGTLFTGNFVLVLAAPLLGVICQSILNLTGRLASACLVHTAFSLGVVGLVPIIFSP